MNTKSCSVCKEIKSVDKFYSNKAKPSGRESACIECFKKKLKKYKSRDYVSAVTLEQLSKERWSAIVIEGVEFPYKISDCGRILNLRTNKIMTKPSLDQRGYPQQPLTNKGCKKSRRIHILVGHVFVENPDNLPELNHKDGNKFNPHYSNLEWNTSKQNKKHSIENGLWKKHELSPSNKKVIDTKSGVIYNSLFEAATKNGMKPYLLGNRLRGVTKNKTTLKYL